MTAAGDHRSGAPEGAGAAGGDPPEPGDEHPLVAVHRTLDEVFELFRELVLVGDGARATTVVRAYGALTALHAGGEDQLLLPLLEAAGRRARWPAALYQGQHVKLLAGIDRMVGLAGRLDARRDGWRFAALRVLDAAAPVMHLAEHHHLAEEQDLFVIAAADAPERLDQLVAAWRDAWSDQVAVIEQARAALAGR